MSPQILGLVIFLFSLLLIELCFYAYHTIQHPDRAEIRKRLRRTVMYEESDEGQNLLKKRILSDIPFLNRLLQYFPGVARLDLLIKQANLKYTPGFFFLSSLSLTFTTYLICSILVRNPFLPVALALFSGSLPILYIRSKKKQRMSRFEKQLPEALGLIARALRAGHAFTSGMKLAADEFGDPLGPEFEDTLDEINFGITVSDALKNLARRVDCPDLGFFVVSVILQRETGGNLAEIIEGLAHLMRERFKFRGKVRTLSAEGRFSGIILLSVPFILFGILYVINRKFITPLIADPIGLYLTAIAVIMMIFGIIAIKRIIKVEV